MKQQGMTNINIRLTAPVHKALKLLCVNRGLTQAQLIEHLVFEANRKEKQ